MPTLTPTGIPTQSAYGVPLLHLWNLSVSDTFTGSNGASWDAIKWRPTLGDGTAVIDTNRGKLSTLDNYRTATKAVLPIQTDQDVLLKFTVPTPLSPSWEWYFDLVLHGQDGYITEGTGDWLNYTNFEFSYWAPDTTPGFFFGSLSIRRNPDGVQSGVQSLYARSPVTLTAGASYWLHARLIGQSIKFRYWIDGTTEPTTWLIDAVDTIGLSWGETAVEFWGGAIDSPAVTAFVDDFTVTPIPHQYLMPVGIASTEAFGVPTRTQFLAPTAISSGEWINHPHLGNTDAIFVDSVATLSATTSVLTPVSSGVVAMAAASTMVPIGGVAHGWVYEGPLPGQFEGPWSGVLTDLGVERLVVGGGYPQRYYSYSLDPTIRLWTSGSYTGYALYHNGSVVLNNKIYITGGDGPGTAILHYDLQDGMVNTGQSLPWDGNQSMAGTDGTFLWVFPYFATPSKLITKYDPATNTTTTVSGTPDYWNLPTSGSAVYNDGYFWFPRDSLGTRYVRYNPVTNVWTKMATLPTGTAGIDVSHVAVGGNNWMFGGNNDSGVSLAVAYTYDVTLDVFTQQPNLNTARYLAKGDYYASRVFAIGGTSSSSSYLSTVESVYAGGAILSATVTASGFVDPFFTLEADVVGSADFPTVTAAVTYVKSSGVGFISDHQKPARPAYDRFIDALLLTGGSGTVTTTDVNATRDFDEPLHVTNPARYVEQISSTIWFKWVCPSAGRYFFNTYGSTDLVHPDDGGQADTVVSVYTGGPLISQLTEIAYNDDTSTVVSSADDLTSVVEFNAGVGTTYWIQVYGYDGQIDSIQLNWGDATPAPGAIRLYDSRPNVASGVNNYSFSGSSFVGRFLVNMPSFVWPSAAGSYLTEIDFIWVDVEDPTKVWVLGLWPTDLNVDPSVTTGGFLFDQQNPDIIQWGGHPVNYSIGRGDLSGWTTGLFPNSSHYNIITWDPTYTTAYDLGTAATVDPASHKSWLVYP